MEAIASALFREAARWKSFPKAPRDLSRPKTISDRFGVIGESRCCSLMRRGPQGLERQTPDSSVSDCLGFCRPCAAMAVGRNYALGCWGTSTCHIRRITEHDLDRFPAWPIPGVVVLGYRVNAKCCWSHHPWVDGQLCHTSTPTQKCLAWCCVGGVWRMPMKKRFPTKFSGFTDNATEALLTKYLPPGFRAYRDDWNSRWQVELGFQTKKYTSRSFGKYGFVAAARLACAAAWRRWEEQGNPPCPIDRLMPVAPASSSGAAQGGERGSAKRIF